ncbi:MAG: MBL fold metallo-hydrolase, partial [Clostridia bacterium]|nr:MBL fold metallo-hydrolase [Clostridia bacterium]
MDAPIQVQANENSTVWYMSNCYAEDFSRCCAEIEQHGYQRKEKNSFCAAHDYCAYAKENDAVFINFFANTNQISVTLEKNCKYFDFADTPSAEKTAPQITQVHLEDFGMSYVIRLGDGRFIIIDGGREFTQDADRLFACLKEGSPHEKPWIAAWILTHPHSDHHLCLQTFLDKYITEVQIEKFLYNYPAHDDLEHYPIMQKSDRRVERNTSPYVNIPLTNEYAARAGAEIFMPHTG